MIGYVQTKSAEPVFIELPIRAVRLICRVEQRIYNDQMKEWDHYWDLILMSSLDTDNKALLKKELEWLGFANISTNLMAYPGCNRIELQRLLVDLNMSEQVVVFKAETLQLFNNSVDTIGRMLRTNWYIDELRQRYLQFLDIFREIGVLLMQENEQLEPVQVLSNSNFADSLLSTDFIERPCITA